ncbi:MAG TPA: hypothetical protein VLM11_16580 [Streptosporangiaceae bacterium]|nr:hypothetical protein [Streptosporangiaceae bacterium]
MASQSLAYRGRAIGVLLMLLGIWGGLVPFVGHYFGYAYSPDKAWYYSSGRLWLSIAPAAAVFLGGLLVVASENAAALGAFLAALGGVWFVIGVPVAGLALARHGITPGTPVASHGAMFGASTMKFLEQLGFFYGVGIVIVFFAAVGLGEVIVAAMAARRYAEYQAGDLDSTQTYGAAY